MDVVVVVERKSELFEVVAALRSPSRLTSLLNRRKKQRDQNRDDRNHDQKFDECNPCR